MAFYPYPKQLYQGQLGSVTALLYTAPSQSLSSGTTQKAIIKEIVVCNTDSASHTYTLNLVASGGAVGAANELFAAMAIAANTTVVYRFSCVMEGGSSLHGLADAASKITVTVSGVELI